MIKKLPVSELKVGMYVSDLDANWLEHSFVSNQFLIKDEDDILRIEQDGLRHVYIDTEKGSDAPHAPEKEAVAQQAEEEMHELAQEPAKPPHASIDEERIHAEALCGEATSLIQNMMVRLHHGERIEMDAVEPVTEKLIASIFRNPHAMTSVARIKTKDQYTFMHSVSAATLMIAFAHHLELDDIVIQEVAKGALLHDIGKVAIPNEILNKPGKLTDHEFSVMKSHVVHSTNILRETDGFSDIAMEAVSMHHERIDGTGYPHGLKHDAISLIGQMSAIVDVYDALTSVRVYKDAWEPSYVLKKLLEWSPHHFNSDLIQRFIRCMGIYPVGSLVELDDGLLAIITDQTNDLLRPELRIIYDGKRQTYLPQRTVSLAEDDSLHIKQVVQPRQYDLDISNFI